MAHEKVRGKDNVRIHEAKDRTTNMVSLGCFAQHGLKIARTLQTVAGVLCVVLCVVGIVSKAYNSSYAWSLFAGLLVFILTGIVAAIHNHLLLPKPIERVYIVTSFISAIYSAIMMIIVGVKTNSVSVSYSCYKLYYAYCDEDLFGQMIVDVLLILIFWVEIGCGMMGAMLCYWASNTSDNTLKEYPQTLGNTPLGEKYTTIGSPEESSTLRISREYATVVSHKDKDKNDIEKDIANDNALEETNNEMTSGEYATVIIHSDHQNDIENNIENVSKESNDESTLRTSREYATVIIHSEGVNNIENDIANDIVLEGTNDETTLQAPASVDNHGVSEVTDPERKTSDGSEAEYMSMAGYCHHSSDYEIMQDITYVNVRHK